MIRLFPKCKGILTVGLALMFMVSAALYKEVLPWYWALTVFAVGSALVFFVVSLMALKMHNRLLYVFYGAMKPKDFTSFYAELTDRAGLRSNVRFTMKNYLCNAYIASGEFKKALNVLQSLPVIEGRNAQKAKDIIASNRCSVYLDMGELGKAASELSKIESSDRELLDIRLRLLQGGGTKDDADTVRELMKKSSTPYQRLALRYVYAQLCEATGELSFAKTYYDEISKADAQLFISGEAKRKLKRTN